MNKVTISIFSLFVFFSIQIHAQNISAVEARDIALGITGGGELVSLELVTESAIGPVYQIVIAGDNVQHNVSINAATGEIFALTSGQTGAAAPAQQTAQVTADTAARHFNRQGIDLTALGITPAPPPHWFRLTRPRNPPVSRANAVEIGYLFLTSRGFPHANFRRHQLFAERDYGRWAWQLYFMDGWREIELYIDMHSGDVVMFDIDFD